MRTIKSCALTHNNVDAYTERFRLVTRYPWHNQTLSSSTSVPVDIRNTTDVAYAVVWDSRAQPEPTCWISSVNISSSSALLPNITQTFSPGTVAGGYARVSLETSGKRVRLSGTEYYFDYEEAVDKWDLEDELYRNFAFRSAMLGLLLVVFAGMTILGVYL